jgi:ribosome-associated protein
VRKAAKAAKPKAKVAVKAKAKSKAVKTVAAKKVSKPAGKKTAAKKTAKKTVAKKATKPAAKKAVKPVAKKAVKPVAKKAVVKKVAAKKPAAKTQAVAKPAAKAAPKAARKVAVAAPVAPPPNWPPLVMEVLKQLDDSKAEQVVTIDVSRKSTVADVMVVASGRSNRHVSAIAEQVVERLGQMGKKGLRVEGMPQCDWVLVDAGDVMVHVFRPEVRSFYNLEKLWSEHAPV